MNPTEFGDFDDLMYIIRTFVKQKDPERGRDGQIERGKPC